MPDAMDAVQQLAADHVDDALKRHQARSIMTGRSTCANLDCGEPIGRERTILGAQLCMECQREHDGRAAHFRTWGRR